ncbi:hypothetical protein [Halanaeroarchaeum sulfurireducens]|uniref:Uncharacterized protein n=1 Tax=Halanaeroarchaeum sulfurireducens TaxID=1604004 RepID=A0A0F7P8H1_9EURY|nr:hypothetical protein [Halanaeroarchaeum sulfurireducens]AKH97461.1 hypothetical protein HLASF_0971 [Halanaeroarchaeum sulfurireducens]
MSEANWGSGDVLSRKVGNHIQEILPANLQNSENAYFEQDGILRGELLPEDATEGTIHIVGGVGEDSQFKVLVEKTLTLNYVSDEGEPIERTVQLTFYRAESKDLDELAPFEYTVTIREMEREATRTETRIPTIADIATDRYLGREETLAALLLTEIIANKKASSGRNRTERLSHAGSLAQLGSINAAIDNNRFRFGWGLDWETLNDLLGPDAETIISKTSVETTTPERRKAASQKGIDFLADDGILEGDSTAETSGLQSDIDDLLTDTVTNVFEEEDYIISQTRSELFEAREKYTSLVDSFPDEFVESLANQNFGTAKTQVTQKNKYDRMVLAYSFKQLFDGVNDLLAAQDSIEDLSLAVNAFANGIAADDIEMAERGLQNATSAFIQVTQHLMEDGKRTIESIRPLLAFHELVKPFNQRLSETAELTGDELAFYESAVEEMEETAREQHERAEKAREVFYIYT